LNYGGLQRNPGKVTIESNLFSALLNVGSISPDCDYSTIYWQSCARTDKGVSAVGNVVSCEIKFQGLTTENINAQLPADIRVIALRRVGKRFTPKHRCDSRLYSYILPTWIFAPSPFNKNNTSSEPFKFNSDTIALVNSALKYYEGTHNFHNFTAKGGPKTHNNASATRYILSAKCGEPFMIDDQEWVEISILGQSFIIYQIRKMIALAFSIARDGANPRVILSCFEKPKKILPIAPALGLFLSRCNFEDFNQNATLKLDWTQEEEAFMKDYKYSKIIPAIVQHNKEKEVFSGWIKRHDEHPLNYDLLYCTVDGEYQDKLAQLGQSQRPIDEESLEDIDED